jgi:hypothetical protein
MFKKQLILSGFLLLSSAAPLCAMDADMTAEDNSNDMQLGSTGLEGSDSVVESAETEKLDRTPVGEESSIYGDSMATESEQPTPMKKRTAPMGEEDMSIGMDESLTQNSGMNAAQEPVSEMPTADEYQASLEEKTDDQGHADVQGVFESMSREEEDESFPG